MLFGQRCSILVLGILTTLLLAPSPVAAQDAAKARTIMEEAIRLRKVESSEAVSTMTIYNAKGQTRVRKIAMITKLYDGGKTEKRLVRFLSPADVKGTGLLTFDFTSEDDSMWLYMPALRKTRRIVSRERSKSFMGSEFTYDDMVIPNLDEFTLALLGEEEMDGTPCWKVEQRPKNEDLIDEHGYAKRVAWVGKKDYVLRRAEYFDSAGKRFKVMTTGKVQPIGDGERYRAYTMRIDNEKNGRASELVIEKLEVGTVVNDDYFTTRYLER